MGGVLAWHQSQLRIGGCLGNGTSDLIYPLVHPLVVRARRFLLVHISLATHTVPVTLLCMRVETLVPSFFFPHAKLKNVATST